MTGKGEPCLFTYLSCSFVISQLIISIFTLTDPPLDSQIYFWTPRCELITYSLFLEIKDKLRELERYAYI